MSIDGLSPSAFFCRIGWSMPGLSQWISFFISGSFAKIFEIKIQNLRRFLESPDSECFSLYSGLSIWRNTAVAYSMSSSEYDSKSLNWFIIFIFKNLMLILWLFQHLPSLFSEHLFGLKRCIQLYILFALL